MNKATVPTTSGFTEGVNRSPSQANMDSLVVSGYKTSPRSPSEVTVSPIQQGQTDVHYDVDASGRPTISPTDEKSNPMPLPCGSC